MVVARGLLFIAVVACGAVVAAVPASAQAPDSSGRLLVTVDDGTGVGLPGAEVTLSGQEDATRAVVLTEVTDNTGVAKFEALPVGRYTLQVELAGFDPVTVLDVRVRTGDNRREVTLRLRFYEELAVEEDTQSIDLDPTEGRAFATFLSREMIDALPDDPEQMALVLEAMAPPGAVILVDGFQGGTLPPKSLIKSIRIPRMDEMAAQYHGSGDNFLFILVETQPGTGPVRGNVRATYFDDALSARNPFTPEKGDQNERGINGVLFGAIVPDRTSFSINVGSQYRRVSPNLLAVTSDGKSVAAALEQPTETRNFGIRVDQALTDDRWLRISLDGRFNDAADLGIGGYNLPERAYSSSSSSYLLRLHERGPVGQRMYSESRLQLSWISSASQAAIEQPTIVVNDAFTAGGAQVKGGQDTFEIYASSDLDYVRGAQSFRFGVLLEGGRYRSNNISNYLGTYTFASLDDFSAGKPSKYSRQVGDPAVTYSLWKLSLYAQDDWRVVRNVMVSAGVRAGFQTLVDDPINVSPRLMVTWAPLRDGSLTLRTAYGYFYDWIPGSLYKQTLLFNGSRLQQFNVPNPPFPMPSPYGTALPSDAYTWTDGLPLDSSHRLVLAMTRKITDDMRMNVAYTLGWGRMLLRGSNQNSPVDGVRPDQQFANVVEMVPDAESKAHRINVGWSLSKPDWKHAYFSANYNWWNNQSNTAGAFDMPAHGDTVDTEWGPLSRTHTFNFSMSMQPVERLIVFLSSSAGAGVPYNITTGHDDNLDGVFNDRPSGVSRNSALTAARWDLDGRVSYTIRMGRPREPGSTVERYGVSLTFNFTNLLNRSNFIGYSGVMTSPFFMLPTNVAAPRSMSLGLKFSF